MIQEKLPKQVLNNAACLAVVLDSAQVLGECEVISMPDIFDIIVVKKNNNADDIVRDYWVQIKDPYNFDISEAIRRILRSYSRTINELTKIDEITTDDIIYLLSLGEEIMKERREEADRVKKVKDSF